MSHTLTEQMICAASALLEDNKTCLVGSGMPLAATSLAKKTHAPNLIMVFEAGGFDPVFTRLPLSVGESITFHKAIYAGGMDDIMGDAARGMIDYGFLGGAQIDPYGDLNSTVIGDYFHPKARFPGSGGANDLGSLCWQTIAIMRHEKFRFKEKIDFITTPGWLGGPDGRRKAGLPTDEPLAMEIVSFFPRPKSAPPPQRWPIAKPDASNIQKAVEDALHGIVFVNDSHVVSIETHKRYCVNGMEPQTRVEVWTAGSKRGDVRPRRQEG